MYNIPVYKEEHTDELLSFIKRYPLGFISGINDKNEIVGTHIPLLIEKRENDFYLLGHMMKATDHYVAFQKNRKVFTVFNGPNAYVSATWGDTKSKGSTWNYMTVHVYGELVFFEDERFIDLMKEFTLHHENGNTESETIYDNLPTSYTNRLMPHITGFEIKVDRMEGVFKLSQDVDDKTYASIISELKVKGGLDALLAEEMLQRKKI